MDGRLVVFGASGQLGRLTAELLLAAGAEPILVARTPEAVADLGCETRFGDYGEPESLRDAYAGAATASNPNTRRRRPRRRSRPGR